MRLHSDYNVENVQSVQSVLDGVRKQVAVIIPPSFNKFQNSFSHIFAGGYAAGYYSYKWAEVLSADAFSLFEENGIFDQATGQKFLDTVLANGGSRSAMDLFVAFRGREPSVDALLRHSGFSKPKLIMKSASVFSLAFRANRMRTAIMQTIIMVFNTGVIKN